MNDHAITSFIQSLYRSQINCSTQIAEDRLHALMLAFQRYLSHSNSGNAIPARDEWLTVRSLAYEVKHLNKQGVIELTEGAHDE